MSTDVPAMDLAIIFEAERTCGSKTIRISGFNDGASCVQIETADGVWKHQMIAMRSRDDLIWLLSESERALRVMDAMAASAPDEQAA